MEAVQVQVQGDRHNPAAVIEGGEADETQRAQCLSVQSLAATLRLNVAQLLS